MGCHGIGFYGLFQGYPQNRGNPASDCSKIEYQNSLQEREDTFMDEKVLTKEAILGSEDLPVESIFIKEWGKSVMLRGLTSAERDQFETTLFVGEGKTRKQNFSNMRARLLAFTICDEKGTRLFADSDSDALGKKSAKVLNKLFAKAQELSGIGEADVEELLKNSEPDQPA